MSEEFDPKKYAEEAAKEEEFDPKAYAINAVKSEPESTTKALIRQGVKALPVAGSLIGGAVAGGGTLGTMSIPGSAMGAAGGKILQNAIEQNYLDEPKTVEDYTIEPAKEAAFDYFGNKVVGPVIGYGAQKIGEGLGHLAAGVSKIPYPVIENYAKNYDEVNKISDIATAADDIRNVMQKDIKGFKLGQNNVIREALQSKGEMPVDITSTLETLKNAQAKIDKTINPEWYNRIQREIDIIDAVRNTKDADEEMVKKYFADLDLYDKEMARAKQAGIPFQMELPMLPARPTGQFNPVGGDDLMALNQNLSLADRAKKLETGSTKWGTNMNLGPMVGDAPTPPQFGPYKNINASQAHQIAQRLQNLADYTVDGQALKRKDLVDVVMSVAAKRARNSVDMLAPEIKAANTKLAQLHTAGKNLNKNIITPDKPYGAMLGIGRGENKLASNQLKRFEDTIGKSYLPDIKNLTSAQYYGDANILPGEKTGSSLAPMVFSGSFGIPTMLTGDVMTGAKMMATGLPLTPIGQKALIGAGTAANKIGITPTRIGAELGQVYTPDVLNYLGNMIPQPETPTQKAQRINQERKAIKGGQ